MLSLLSIKETKHREPGRSIGPLKYSQLYRCNPHLPPLNIDHSLHCKLVLFPPSLVSKYLQHPVPSPHVDLRDEAVNSQPTQDRKTA